MLTMQSKKAAPRVPFGALVENGLIQPGATLTDLGRRYRARVRADGSVQMDGQEGSSHQIGAAAKGAPSCNGWDFWHVSDGKSLVCLECQRAAARSNLDAERKTVGSGKRASARVAHGGGRKSKK